ncbi:hypothetical protein TorRG33x02_159250 [Trema orientale]|uniref:Uncharacterized protein n=1 Tax=Trema orientale TaxID=63057 RepID=A0A2P5ES23_TREOI|nr:hypothetical protein TorRG33x02_159250 [Trema orientale]
MYQIHHFPQPLKHRKQNPSIKLTLFALVLSVATTPSTLLRTPASRAGFLLPVGGNLGPLARIVQTGLTQGPTLETAANRAEKREKCHGSEESENRGTRAKKHREIDLGSRKRERGRARIHGGSKRRYQI